MISQSNTIYMKPDCTACLLGGLALFKKDRLPQICTIPLNLVVFVINTVVDKKKKFRKAVIFFNT